MANSQLGRGGDCPTTGIIPAGPPSNLNSQRANDTGTNQRVQQVLPDSQRAASIPLRGDSPHNKRRTRANIKIASLNIRGGGSNKIQEKWHHINQLLRQDKIGILALQETHSTDALISSLHALFGKRLHIYHSSDPDAPNSKGVAIVLNKEILHTNNIQHHDIIPGRALLLSIPWHSSIISILAIYAPNTTTENEAFWSALHNKWTELGLPKPDIMLGDFNLVEEALDRLPSHPDNQAAVHSLEQLKSLFHVQDGWRKAYPAPHKAFTYLQSNHNGSHSRIDRIYITDPLEKSSTDWEIKASGLRTDHNLISVRLSNPKLPFVGKGRWSLPLHLIKDKSLMSQINQLGLALQSDIALCSNHRTQETNPQTLFKTFKDNITSAARKQAKMTLPKVKTTIRNLQSHLQHTLNNDDNEFHQIESSVAIQEKITMLTTSHHQKTRASTAARNRLEGETISKYWSSINNPVTPRDTMFSLRYPNSIPPRYETRSDKMASLARNYHNDLQNNNTFHPPERDSIITDTLNNITVKTPEPFRSELDSPTTQAHVLSSLKAASNGTSPGIDGIPAELWKSLSHKFKTSHSPTNPCADIIAILTCVYNDIESHGIIDGTDFTKGWMCPIYKKKDRREIENYRPITILNTDYKIFTKALSEKLLKAAPLLIHENQAGFIPGRSIFNQVKLSKLMIDYCEAQEINGAIIALDQEKAYDKIAHDYLWNTLRKFDLPPQFINTVKSLYQSAETVVIINGEISPPFKVTRGVRQGDPLSCLLFDLAIEPLAAMLRNSHLQGMKIPGVLDKVLTSLFADDITAFLSALDKFSDLQSILETWCTASTAKFNVGKTVVIPVGSKTYRSELILTRKLHPDHDPIPLDIHIAHDREATRILGAWIGNDIDPESQWSPTIEKIDLNLHRWGMSHPTIEGRRLIIQMIVAGMSQYLTKVQGMPPSVEKTLTTKIQHFMWDSTAKSPPVSNIALSQSHSLGGKKVLHLESRNKAIHLTWLQSYLTLGPQRPTWAYIADSLIALNILKSQTAKIDIHSCINTFLQNWHTGLTSRSHLPSDLIQMLKVGRDFGVCFDSLQFPQHHKTALPIWLHLNSNTNLQKLHLKKEAKCLRINHHVVTVRHLQKEASRTAQHQNRRNCACHQCKETRQRTNNSCTNPHMCHKIALMIINNLQTKWNPMSPDPVDGLDLSPHQLEANNSAFLQNMPVLFNPSTLTTGPLHHNFRVFTDNQPISNEPPTRPPLDFPTPANITVYTDGSCFNNGDEDAQAGCGIWYGCNDPRNTSLKIQGSTQSNQAGEILAILHAARSCSTHCALHIRSDSKYAISMLTTNLQSCEDKGWIGIANKDLFKATVACLRSRSNITTLQWVRGHCGDEGNEGADQLAKLGANKANSDHIDLSIEPQLNLHGAKLAKMSQSLLYKGIIERSNPPQRKSTVAHLDITRRATKALSNHLPTDARIWFSIRNKDITRTIRCFLWKCLHNTYKVGSYWDNIPSFETRADCPICGIPESMEHILTECDSPAQNLIWNLAKALWLKWHPVFPEIKFGTILGCSLAEFKDSKGKISRGDNRLFRILITESAHLIWKLRCERRIAKQDNPDLYHSETEIHNRWLQAINARLALDQLLSNKAKYQKKALPTSLVLCTWSGILLQETNLPSNWIRESGVLVGIESRRPPGQNR